MSTPKIEQTYPNTYAPAILSAIEKEQKEGWCNVCNDITKILKQSHNHLFDELYKYVYCGTLISDSKALEELKTILCSLPQEYVDELIIAYSIYSK